MDGQQVSKGKRVLEGLKAARALIARRGGWARGVYARNRLGEEVLIHRPEAVSFCALGALQRAMPVAVDYYNARMILQSVVKEGVASFNDKQRRKKAVLDAFDKAIRVARRASKR